MNSKLACLRWFGKLIALALLNGCPGPHFLCQSVASFINLDNSIEVVLNEVPTESEIKAELLEIRSCNIQAEVSDLVNSFLEKVDMG